MAATAAKVEEPQDIADEPTEETNAVDADEAESASADTPATEVDIEPIEDEVPSTEEDAAKDVIKNDKRASSDTIWIIL